MNMEAEEMIFIFLIIAAHNHARSTARTTLINNVR